MVYYYRSFINNVILPVYDTVRGTKRRETRQILEKTQWNSKVKIEENQKLHLMHILKHAYETVPFYNRLFKENNIRPEDIKEQKDLSKLPVLTKSDLQDDITALISKNYPEDQLIPYHSGGTGNFTRFFITKEQKSWELGAEYRAYGWAGYQLGDKATVFWGSLFDAPPQMAFLKRATNWIERIKLYSTYVQKDEVLDKQIKGMQNQQPEIIRGYAGSLYIVSKRMLENNITSVKPRAVITSAETLLPEYRKIIEDAFGCKVFDHYGSREIGAIASECEEHMGYHISSENVLLEFVKDGEHVAPGEQGEILATNLRNFGMPLIRYALGDAGKPSDELCNCGRGLLLMDSVDGRVFQFISLFDSETGEIIPLQAADPGVIGVVMDKVPQKTYRVYQETLEKILIEIVPREIYSEKHTEYIMDYLNKHIGKYIIIEIKLVDEIAPLPSGKRSVVNSKINPFRI